MTMAEQDFFSESTRRRVREAIERAEAVTSAEVVVALRRSSVGTRGPTVAFGAACAFATLVALVVLPRPFAASAFVIDVALAFAFAALGARLFPAVLRAFVPEQEALEEVHRAAAAEFLRRKVHGCRGRNGVLVFVSMLERRVEVLADLGIEAGPREELRRRAQEALDAADVEAFALTIEAAGGALAGAHPREDDDVDELGDDVAPI